MAVENFAPSLAKVLKHEGGYVNNPKDPGGATNKGVTQSVYDAWRSDRGLPRRPVAQLGNDELPLIYRGRFWDPVRGNELPIGVDYVVFDGSVNSGPSQSAKWLQRALGVTADGKVGPVTVTAARTSADLATLVDDMLDQRLAFMKKIKHRETGALLWTTFGKGWQRRIDGVRKDALAMIAGRTQSPSAGQGSAPLPEATTITHRDVKNTGKQAGLIGIIAAVLGAIVTKVLGLW